MSKYAIKDWSESDFFQMATWFGERWSKEFPALSVWTCKWRHEDLIPGLSDMDPRVVFDDMSAEEWVSLDELAYETHLELTKSRPDWARKLEHTPGVCSTKAEVLNEALYQPEMRNWDYYWGDREFFEQIKAFSQRRSWEPVDEYYFLVNRFVPWCTPYNHDIDPAVNIPSNILPKYALHSRAMHYFMPCIKAALAVINRDSVTGKREALYRWMQIYPNEPVLREVAHLLDVNYEVSWLEDEQAWLAFEDRLWQFIRKITPEVLRAVTIVDLGDDLSMENLRRKCKQIHGRPLTTLYNGVRFSRIRKGRWRFYLNAPDFFDAEHCAYSETSWMRSTFTYPVFDSYACVKWGEHGLDIDEILARMVPEMLDRGETHIVKQVFESAAGNPTPRDAMERLRKAAEVYADYYRILDRMLADALRTVKGKAS